MTGGQYLSGESQTESGRSTGKGSAKSGVSDVISTVVLAAQTAGPMMIRQEGGAPAGVAGVPGPLQVIGSAISGLFGGIRGALKDKKRLVTIIVMTLIWLLLLLLPALGVDSGASKLLSFLTFAQGGTAGGLLGIAGGVVGKGVFSCFIFSFIVPLFSGQNPFKGMGGSFRALFSQSSVQGGAGFSFLLLGLGAALIAYNFFVGSASLQNSMMGIASLLLGLRALVSRAGFLRSFAVSLSHKIIGGREADLYSAGRFIAGWSAGSAAAVPLSALPIGTLPYLVGALCLIVGLLLSITARKSGKEAPAV